MKVAVVGRGFGASMMAPAYEKVGFEVEIVPSREPDQIAQACKSTDLISIHSPPFQHREHVMMALEAGVDVLCDKPFGRNADEAREMRDAAKAAGVLHFLNYEFRHQPSRVKVRELINAGEIGRLQHISITSYGRGLHGRPHGWLNDAELGGGWIGAYGSHVIDALRFWFGREVADCGGLSRMDEPVRRGHDGEMVPSTAEDAFSAWFRMEEGGTASLDTGYSMAVNLPARTHIMGSEGAITIDSETMVRLHKPKQDDKVFDFSPKPGDFVFPAIPLWLAEVKQAITDRRQITPDFNDGVAAAKVMDRLKSAISHA